LYFAENFEEVGFIPFFEGSQKILIPFDQSVKWSALLTSGKETRNSDFANLKINKIKNILNLWCKIDSIHEGLSKVVVSRKKSLRQIVLI
jgi:isochorismate synthase